MTAVDEITRERAHVRRRLAAGHVRPIKRYQLILIGAWPDWLRDAGHAPAPAGAAIEALAGEAAALLAKALGE